MLFRLSEIQKSYSGQTVLRGVTLQVNRGEKIGLVGRNGVGKTTLFRLITGEEMPDSGEIVKVNNLRIGVLAQHVDFSETETVHTSALVAFEKIHRIEAEMRRLEKQMENDASDEILTKYAELQAEFELEGGFSYAAKAEAVLLGLGFPQEIWHQPAKTLSGGQKNRLGLVRLLLSEPDVLLLDEPTNHLDVKAVEWLENYLLNEDKTYVIISHDRYFLDGTTNKIIEIENGKVFSYSGNYSAFVIQKKLRREQQRREFENQQAFIARTEEFIRRNLEGQKTKQAKSRRNLLERMERVEAVMPEKPGGNFNLEKVERASQNVLTVENLAIGYGLEKILAEDISFTLQRGECLGLIGANGTGKTTFLKTILGLVPQISGKILWGTKTNIGYYSQNLEDLDPHNEVIQELRRVAPLAENGELRSFLAGFLFFGDDVFKLVRDLSGGEKGRLALAKLIYAGKNVLVLDEPTNHLDIPSREALEDALTAYPGTIITVSHDRFFLDKIATQILSLESGGKAEIHNGNYTEFQEWKLKREQERSKEKNCKPAWVEEKKNKSQKARPKDALSKNQRQKIEKRIAEIEEEIPLLEEKSAQLSFEMSLPEIASNHEKLAEINQKYQSTEREIQALYEEWEKLAEEIS